MVVSKENAIRLACRIIGFRSSVQQLADKAQSLYLEGVIQKWITFLFRVGKIATLNGELFYHDFTAPSGYNVEDDFLSDPAAAKSFDNFCRDYGYGSISMSYSYIVIVRKKVMREAGTVYDIRTHKDCPARNMVNKSRRAA